VAVLDCMDAGTRQIFNWRIEGYSMAEIAVKLGKQSGTEQLSGRVVVAFLQGPAELKSSLAVAGSGGSGHGQQLVSHLGHGADYHHRLLLQTALDDRAGALGGVLSEEACVVAELMFE
jgi:hypothetical protein